MPLICPTSQIALSKHSCLAGRLLLCMGLFSIFWDSSQIEGGAAWFAVVAWTTLAI
jgi:hypothetical protein